MIRGVILIEPDGPASIANHCYVGGDIAISARRSVTIELDVLNARRPDLRQCNAPDRCGAARAATE